jgi:hypothetical protein
MMIAKEDRRERKGKKVHKKSVPRKNKRSTKTHYFLPKEREKREKSETKKLPKNSSSFFCSSLQKRVIIFHSRHLSYSFITYLKRVFIPSSTTTTTIIPLYYRNDDSDDVRRESKQYE